MPGTLGVQTATSRILRRSVSMRRRAVLLLDRLRRGHTGCLVGIACGPMVHADSKLALALKLFSGEPRRQKIDQQPRASRHFARAQP